MFVPQAIVIAAVELYRVDDMNVNFGSVDMSDDLHDKLSSCPISQFHPGSYDQVSPEFECRSLEFDRN
ncbi:hypothetical protein ACLB2K_015737 [Fragaria x ananassa]